MPTASYPASSVAAGVNRHPSHPCGPNGKVVLHKVEHRAYLGFMHHGPSLSPGGQQRLHPPMFPGVFHECLHAHRPASCIKHGYFIGTPYKTRSHGDFSGLSYRLLLRSCCFCVPPLRSDCVAYCRQLSLSAFKLSLGAGDVLV
jgi:hypothetical protein